MQNKNSEPAVNSHDNILLPTSFMVDNNTEKQS